MPQAMAFKDFAQPEQGVQLLQRSLERGRLAHAYLFIGHHLDDLEVVARTLAKTLNCRRPVRKNGAAVDCCDQCLSCRKIEAASHPDMHWLRPESKSRIITVEQIRDLIREVQLKPTEAEYKAAAVVAADRLKVEAANAFLKTLEEPPPKSILILLSTEPQRILETILSRCLRLNLGASGPRRPDAEQLAWLTKFSEISGADQRSLIGRYRLMDVLLRKLNRLRELIEKQLTDRSPLQRYPDAEKEWQEKWENELKAAIEAEYRRQRADWLGLLQRWLRDVWLHALSKDKGISAATGRKETGGLGVPSEVVPELLNFPELPGGRCLSQRISPAEAMANLLVMEQLQHQLATNVQEALALEVGLLRLHL
jgi:DNA polymerase-3 subunit delta'